MSLCVCVSLGGCVIVAQRVGLPECESMIVGISVSECICLCVSVCVCVGGSFGNGCVCFCVIIGGWVVWLIVSRLQVLKTPDLCHCS